MKILHTDCKNYPPEALAELQTIGEVLCCPLASKEELVVQMSDVDILIVRMDTAVDRAVLDVALRLKIVASATTGVNHLDLPALEARGIKVITLRGETKFLETIPSTAELTFGLVLALLRKISEAAEATKNGIWKSAAFQGRELRGKTLGLVGYGRVGRMVARYARAFDMEVLAYDPHVGEHVFAEDGVRRTSFDALLQRSNIVSLHATHTRETDCMMDRAAFSSMRPGSYLVNTARGELVDEAALLEALESGHLAGAAVDVLADENAQIRTLESHPLVRYAKAHAHLIVTPHIAGMAIESVHKTSMFIAKSVAAYVRVHGLK